MTASVERRVCTFCAGAVDPAGVESAAVPSNVRAFKHEIFHVWRCPQCRSLHCLEVVDLARYYANYPIPRTLSDSLRAVYDNQITRLTDHGLTAGSQVLDYGCGAGLFLQRLRERGYTNATGYDPYSSNPDFRNPEALALRFDFVVLQDVIEHVEDPRALLAELDAILNPGGAVLVGTPRADGISLGQPMKYWLQLHPPYHLHIYTRTALEELGRGCGWSVEQFYDRPYYDTKTIGLNARVIDKYKWFHDGTLDSYLEPVPERVLRRSIRFMFFRYFGYWFKQTGEVALLFRKPLAVQPARRSEVESVERRAGRRVMREAGVTTESEDPCRRLYLELLKKSLLGLTYEDGSNVAPSVMGEQAQATSYNAAMRQIGRDWPVQAPTMIGMARINNLQHCVERVIADQVPGDVIETGVWRGGSCIFMRGVLKAHGVTDRTVWVADSFEGLPPPNTEKYPQDAGLHFEQYKELAVSLEEVKRNFERYDLLDDQVRFLKGWFRDSLPRAPIGTLAVLRLDGDLYESTTDALTNLYDKLSPGGFVIVDDYSIPACKLAVHDFRGARGIIDPIEQIDWTGVFWRRSR